MTLSELKTGGAKKSIVVVLLCGAREAIVVVSMERWIYDIVILIIL